LRLPHAYTLGALLAATLAIGACGGGDATMETADGQRFSKTDVRFVQNMLPHHEQALRTSEIAIEDGADPRVGTLARAIVKAQKQEIATMQEMLEQFGAPEKPAPADQQMVWDKNVADEREADSPREVDLTFLTNMIPHHAAAIPMSQLEIEQGAYGPAVELAEQIKATQRMEIKEMKRLVRTQAGD
jgi:uncharacterized protein (DUF305 family)